MAYITNQVKMMVAVLMDEQLMKYGGYTLSEIPENIYTAMDSDNYVINSVATIIHHYKEGATNKEIYNQINQYLQTKV